MIPQSRTEILKERRARVYTHFKDLQSSYFDIHQQCGTSHRAQEPGGHPSLFFFLFPFHWADLRRLASQTATRPSRRWPWTRSRPTWPSLQSTRSSTSFRRFATATSLTRPALCPGAARAFVFLQCQVFFLSSSSSLFLFPPLSGLPTALSLTVTRTFSPQLVRRAHKGTQRAKGSNTARSAHSALARFLDCRCQQKNQGVRLRGHHVCAPDGPARAHCHDDLPHEN